MIVVWLFLAVPWVSLQFVSVVFPDHTHLRFLWMLCILTDHFCRMSPSHLSTKLINFEIILITGYRGEDVLSFIYRYIFLMDQLVLPIFEGHPMTILAISF